MREREEERTFKSASDALDGYFLPKKNVVYERFIFGEAVQEPHESIDQFATRLRNLCDHCQSENIDDAVRDQLVKACISTKLKKFALREGSREEGQCDLKSLLDFGHAQERGESQARQMNNGNSSNNDLGHVYAVSSRKKDGRVKAQQTFKKNASKVRQTAAAKPKKCCFHRGGEYPHSTVCPAQGKTCRSCSKIGHFASVCRPKRKKQVVKEVVPEVQLPDLVSSSSEDEVVYTVSNPAKRGITLQTKINKTTVLLSVDSGATVNLLNKRDFQAVNKKVSPIILQQATIKLFPYNYKEPIPVLGKIQAQVEFKHNNVKSICFYVVDSYTSTSLIGLNTALELGLLKVNDVVEVNQYVNTLPIQPELKAQPKPKGNQVALLKVTNLLQNIRMFFRELENLKISS